MTEIKSRLEKLTEEFKTKTDSLGQTIDEGILKTVVILNALGFHTTQSCEGHEDWGSFAPWVDIKAEENEDLKNEVRLLFNKMNQNGTKDPGEIEKITKEYHEKVSQFYLPTRLLASKLIDLLNQFYENRSSSQSVRLFLSFDGSLRLQSQGAVVQEIFDGNKRRLNLSEFQKEMHSFTDFLETKIAV